MSSFTYRVCGSPGPFRNHRAREMQFGTREEFDYLECEACGSVQIEAVPSPTELARHYPDAYYSFQATAGTLRDWLGDKRDKHSMRRFTPAGALYARLRPDTTLPLLVRVGLKADDRIVDVGAGRGQLLDRLTRQGFRNVLGIDPFISEDLTTADGVVVKKVTINDVVGEFDVIMFNHSLEHVPDPLADLVAARTHLAPGGLCLVRLPTTDSVGWAEHGVNWASMDPPRHLVLPSRHGLIDMAARAGLEHVETIDDSHADQYLLSELYAQGISASDPEAQTTFGPADRKRFKETADKANADSRGDQAMFVFRAPKTA